MGKSLIYMYTQHALRRSIILLPGQLQHNKPVESRMKTLIERDKDEFCLIHVGVPQLRLQVFACGLQESWEVSMQGSWIYLVAVSTGFAYKQCSVYFACMKNGMISTTLLLQLRLTRTTSSQHPHSSLFLQTTSLQHTQTCRYVHGLPIRCRASQ